MGFVVALLVLGAWCGSCSAQRQRACVEAGKSDVCICSSATDSSPETVDCSSKTLATVPTGIPASTERLQLDYNQLTAVPVNAFHACPRSLTSRSGITICSLFPWECLINWKIWMSEAEQ
uniref:Variable lymphocyte receptor C n=1 Tax=Petromyzon marinus TaxID=7757 RepID=A0A088S9U6_PETMA|nr:variable lymphocyte receptor C [Petromyzon marinus]